MHFIIVADRVFADGLDTTAYVERIEREFNICIPDEDGTAIKTLGQLCEYAATKCNEPNTADDWVWVILRRITSDELGVMESELQRDTRFVEDLMC